MTPLDWTQQLLVQVMSKGQLHMALSKQGVEPWFCSGVRKFGPLVGPITFHWLESPFHH